MKYFLILVLIINISLFSQEQVSNLKISTDYWQQENYEKAIEYLMMAINTNEVDGKHYHGVGYLYYLSNDYSNAIKYFNKYLEYTEPSESKTSIYELLLECNFRLGDINSANEYLILIRKEDFEYDNKYLRFEQDGYRFITTSGIDDIYYQIKSFKKNNNIIKVWLKWYWDGKSIYSNDQKLIYECCLENGIFNKDKWKFLYNQKLIEIEKERLGEAFAISLEEYDCKNDLNKTTQRTIYKKDGSVLNHFDYSEMNSTDFSKGWNNIVPGTIGEEIIESLCKNE